MSILSKLSGKGGLRVYKSTPLWSFKAEVLRVNTTDPSVSLVDGDYGWSLRIEENGQTAYIPIEGYRDAQPPEGEYVVGDYVATRDYEDGNVFEGDESVRAQPSA